MRKQIDIPDNIIPELKMKAIEKGYPSLKKFMEQSICNLIAKKSKKQ